MRGQVILVDKGPSFKIERGMVYIEDESGGVVYRRAMSLEQFREAIALASAVLAEYDHGGVIPFRRRAKKAKSAGH